MHIYNKSHWETKGYTNWEIAIVNDPIWGSLGSKTGVKMGQNVPFSRKMNIISYKIAYIH